MLALPSDSIILNMSATSKEGALRELAAAAARHSDQLSADTLYNVLIERENIGSTGVGNGVAIPHGKLAGLSTFVLCFGRSQVGVSFDAIDNRPVYLFVLLLSPSDKASEYLQVLARISRILKNPTHRHQLLACASADEVQAVFAEPHESTA